MQREFFHDEVGPTPETVFAGCHVTNAATPSAPRSWANRLQVATHRAVGGQGKRPNQVTRRGKCVLLFLLRISSSVCLGIS